MLDVWYSLTPPTLPPCLSAEERQRRERFVFEKDRLAHGLAHGLKRHILSCYAPQVAAADWQFQVGKWGKPAIIQPVPFQFNLSHSAASVALAIAGGTPGAIAGDALDAGADVKAGAGAESGVAVGVDIEQIKPMTDLRGVAKTVFHPDELDWLWRQPSIENGFFQLWTVKEALLKAAGTGFSLPSAAFACVGLDCAGSKVGEFGQAGAGGEIGEVGGRGLSGVIRATVGGVNWHCISRALDGFFLSVAVPATFPLSDLRFLCVQQQPNAALTAIPDFLATSVLQPYVSNIVNAWAVPSP